MDEQLNQTTPPPVTSPEPPQPHKHTNVGVIVAVGMALLILVGAGAFFLGQNYKKEQTMVQPTPTAMVSYPTIAPTTSSQSTIVIKEFGVQFTLPENLQDLQHKYNDTHGKSVYFSSTSLEQMAKECSVDNQPLGSLAQYAPGDQAPLSDEGTKIEDFPGVQKLGNYYYLYTPPQGLCSPDKNIGETQANQRDMLQNAIKSSLTLSQ